MSVGREKLFKHIQMTNTSSKGNPFVKAFGGAIGGLLALIVVVVMMMSGANPPEQQMPVFCMPAGGSKAVPNGWGPEVDKAAAVAGIPASVLAAQLEAESGWDPQSASSAGAQGLAQFIPGTWATWGNGGDVFDPIAAIGAQGRYMGDLHHRAKDLVKDTGTDPVSLALAGYNAGWGAVELFGGIPPYEETRNYVATIMLGAQKYVGEESTEVVSSCSPAPEVGEGNDLPWGHGPIDVPSPIGMFTRECVDFALFRVNQALGWKTGEPWKTTNSTFRGDGVLLGSANTPGGDQSWLTGWQVKGWPTGRVPTPGAVSFYGPTKDNAYGHVAIVKSLNNDGTFVEEGYNIDMDGSGPNHSYYTRNMSSLEPTMFLYIPGDFTAKPAPKNEG